MKVKIYLVENCYGDSNKVYVGKTDTTAKYRHKKTYGKDIDYNVIDTVDVKDWKYWEKYWIAQHRQWGFELMNKNEGGGGPTVGSRSKESIKSFKLKRKGWNRKGTPQPQSFFDAMVGRKTTDETKQKISIANKGNTPYMKGKIHKEETKQKMSMAHKDIPLSEEHKKSISDAMMGHTKDEVWRNNLSKSASKSFGKTILQLTLDGELIKEWETAKAASTELNLGYTAINNCCRFNLSKPQRKRDKNKLGKYTSFSYIWEYKQ